MASSQRYRETLELAWVGDAVLALYARRRILAEGLGIDNEKAIRMTSNRFLSGFGDASEVEARLGRVYQAQGLEAAMSWIEETLMPVFEKQERRIAPPLAVKKLSKSETDQDDYQRGSRRSRP